MATSENWQLFVHNGRHNHKVVVYNHGHAQTARLTEEQLHQTEQFRKSHKIYNIVAKIKRNRMLGRNTVEEVFCLSAQRCYTVFHRNRKESNVLSEIVVAHQTSIAMIRTWSYVLIMDTMYKTSISLSVVDNTPETAITQGRRKTNSTKRDKSHWEYISIAHRKIGKSSGSGSRSRSSLGSGSGPSPRGRGRLPRSSRGRGRGRGRNSDRSSLSSVVNRMRHQRHSSSTQCIFGFIYEFILNRKNVVGDGNCEFRVVSNFLFGDENHWVEIRRRMCFDLHHHMNVYVQLFGSVERVTELIRQTNWEEGSAPADYWMDVPAHLYVIPNTFNLCIVFLARLGSTTVLPLISNIDGNVGTIFIGFIEEQQHFIQLHLRDGCPLPPLKVKWEYHRDVRVSGWGVPYCNWILDWVARYREMYPPQSHSHVIIN
ncbi:hypothetical protein M9H77_02137 [Catharanthus roseus]|uniref:Uncharacterized protein n=1 Tax=Catharanthus roseus TaxID=4058 RepID=A0ACC0C7N4_CATRO|nr:hypothetical protein M9H77_02137 [Catharanthus roseus]